VDWLHAHDFGFYGKVRSPFFDEKRVSNLSIFYQFYGHVRRPYKSENMD
jgi:hypothetical protein